MQLLDGRLEGVNDQVFLYVCPNSIYVFQPPSNVTSCKVNMPYQHLSLRSLPRRAVSWEKMSSFFVSKKYLLTVRIFKRNVQTNPECSPPRMAFVSHVWPASTTRMSTPPPSPLMYVLP